MNIIKFFSALLALTLILSFQRDISEYGMGWLVVSWGFCLWLLACMLNVAASGPIHPQDDA